MEQRAELMGQIHGDRRRVRGPGELVRKLHRGHPDEQFGTWISLDGVSKRRRWVRCGEVSRRVIDQVTRRELLKHGA